MQEEKIAGIVRYIQFLENECGLFVSVHSFRGGLCPFMHLFGKYNTHYHPFCIYIKAQKGMWEGCLAMQNKVMARGVRDMFYGRCYCGVEEYVLPFFSGGLPAGIICVTGYCADGERKKRIAKTLPGRFGINPVELTARLELLESRAPERGYIEAVLAHLADMLTLLSDTCGEAKSEGADSAGYIYANVLAYINNHFTEQISVADIADFCKCSNSYINHIFKTLGGDGIRSCINRLRIERAKLLLQGGASVKEAAFSVGYNDSNYFSNVFSRYVGVYPKKYKQSHCGITVKNM